MATTVDEYGNIVDEPTYSFDPYSGEQPYYGGTVSGGVNTTFDPYSGEQPYDGGTFTPGGIGTLGGGSDITSALNKLFGSNLTGKQLAALAGVAGGGLAGLMGGLNPKINKVGYQGGIPKYDAVRNMVTAPVAGRRPGAGGTHYGGDVTYVPKGTMAGLAATQPSSGGSSTLNDLAKVAGVGGLGYLASQYLGDQNNPFKGVTTDYVSTRIGDARTPQPTMSPTQDEGNAMDRNVDWNAAFASGGLASGRYLQGDTDGMADKIPAKIGADQPAALSHGEFVIPADVVSHLGNGNSDAGAKKLYSMMDKIREARTGTKKQGREINPDKFMPGGLAKAYADGGSVKHFVTGGDTGIGTAAAAGVTGTEQAPSSWAGDYITNMLGKGQALSEMPYQEYGGPLTAGASDLQNQAFQTAGNLSVPAGVGTAMQTAGDISNKAQNLSYTPATFGNQFQAPTQTAATNFTNQYQAPTPYQNTSFNAGIFGNEQAQQYMNPYLQQSLNPQLAEARRQADITAAQNNAAMTKAGAFGGGRQAILTAENQRNLGTKLADITGQGYNTAYTNAMNQYNQDQARNLQAQQMAEQSKQFGAQQGMTAAQMMAQYGMSAQQAQEAARQFQQNQAMTGAQQAAQYGLAGQQAGEASRQFGANLGLQGLNTGLQAAQAQGNLGISSGQLGLQNLQSQLAAGAQQRGIEAEGIAADQAAFAAARDNPYKMVQFQQSLLNGLPITATNYAMTQPNALAAAAGGATTASDLLNILSGNAPAKKI
jgi:hypothetical protein